MATEIEIKLVFSAEHTEAALTQLLDVLCLQNIDASFKESRLENSYFDTPEFALHANKVALRIRRKLDSQGQMRFIQTLKTAGKSEGGLSRRGEWEWPLEQAELDLAKLKECEGWPRDVACETLDKIFETNFTRYACELTKGASLIELVLDCGEVISNGRQESIHEIELELKQGKTEDLLALSQGLQKALPVRPFDISKAERGFNLYKHGRKLSGHE